MRSFIPASDLDGFNIASRYKLTVGNLLLMLVGIANKINKLYRSLRMIHIFQLSINVPLERTFFSLKPHAKASEPHQHGASHRNGINLKWRRITLAIIKCTKGEQTITSDGLHRTKPTAFA